MSHRPLDDSQSFQRHDRSSQLGLSHKPRHRDRRSMSPKMYRERSDRSRSPQKGHSKHDRASHHEPKNSETLEPEILPFNAKKLFKHDFTGYRPLFATYLDIQKQLYIEDLPESEAKGRWKAFMRKWNRGELAEGWYDPATKKRALDAVPAPFSEDPKQVEAYRKDIKPKARSNPIADESDEDLVGPPMPEKGDHARMVGPAVPRMEDLQLRAEMQLEDDLAVHEDLRYARRMDRKEQMERLDELVPRAEAGTRERQLEKKKEVNEKMRPFRDKSPGAMAEVGESEMMGGDDSLESYRARKKQVEKKKDERALKKEEILRARAVEREERLQEHRAKEEKTMAMLKALAKQQFG